MLLDKGHKGHPPEVSALVAATENGTIVGLAHHRRFARLASGTTGIYLDDLMTHPDHGGNGIARALIQEVTAIAGRTDASVVRWITAADNTTAKHLYDDVADSTNWVTYDASPR